MDSVMNLSLPCPARTDAPIAKYTTFGMGGAPRLLVEPRNRDELVGAIQVLRGEGIPFRMLGGGANVIVHDRGVDEAVVLTTGFSFMTREDEGTLILRLSAGLTMQVFIARMREIGQTGAERLVGIPGTIGGATVMNAGGAHGWLSDITRRVRVLMPTGEEEEVEVTDETFGYRSSIFGDDKIVLETVVELQPGNSKEIQRKGGEILKAKSAAQPLTQKSAGCVFKNAKEESAGRLLDSVGLKGLRVGGAEVSAKHANFIVNRGDASMADVHALIDEMRRRVFEERGITLDQEVKVWARDAE